MPRCARCYERWGEPCGAPAALNLDGAPAPKVLRLMAGEEHPSDS